jgi:hypothetical protein
LREGAQVHVRRTRSLLSRSKVVPCHAPGIGLGLFALATSACGDGTAPPDLARASRSVPALASLLDAASASRPRLTAGGFELASLPSPTAAGRSTFTVDASGPVRATIGRGGALSLDVAGTAFDVRRLGASDGEATSDGVAITTRDREGRARSMLLSHHGGLEDLLVDDGDAELGYEVSLPRGFWLERPTEGLVQIRDGAGRTRGRVVAQRAWDAEGRPWPVAVDVDGRKIRLHVADEAARPVLIDPDWQSTHAPALVRSRATATLLPDGRVLLVGGTAGADEVLSGTDATTCSTEIYDPLTGTWEAGPDLRDPSDAACTPVMDQAAVPLPDGTVLVAGGANRRSLLGANQPAALADAWIYHPSTRSFERIAPMNVPRVHHTATLLRSGKVLITGGADRQTPLGEDGFLCPKIGDQRCQRCVGQPSAELFDPATRTFEKIDMPVPRACHTATLLDDDSVLLVGGGGAGMQVSFNGDLGKPLSSMSLYRPGAGFTELASSLHTARMAHTAVYRPDVKQLLVAFGRNDTTLVGPPLVGTDTAEIVDVAQAIAGGAGAVTPVVCAGSCPEGREYAAGILTRDGTAKIVGGQLLGQNTTAPSAHADELDFATSTFTASDALLFPVRKPVVTMLPNGKALLVGETAPAMLLDSPAPTYSATPMHLSRGRIWAGSTLLPSGQVLVVGGASGQLGIFDDAEIFDPATGQSTPIASKMQTPRVGAAVVSLPDVGGAGARVLVIGGIKKAGMGAVALDPPAATETADLFDPATQAFTPTGSLVTARGYASAVRLADGDVLVLGGVTDAHQVLSSAELYHVDTGTFSALPNLSHPRQNPTATLLASGDVLVAGGFSVWGNLNQPTGELSSAEIYDHRTRTFREIGSMAVARALHTATALPGGRVLVAGGSASSQSAEVFDEATERFHLTGPMQGLRLSARATMLPSGKVLVSGGAPSTTSNPRADAEVFDPESERFDLVTPTGTPQPRWDHASTLLLDGRVALFGGASDGLDFDDIDSVEILGAPQGAPLGPPPSLTEAPPSASPGLAYPLTGADLTSSWHASAGPYPSPSNLPLAIWLPLSGSPSLGSITSWSETGATWIPPASAYAGPGILVTVRNGEASNAEPVALSLADIGVACDADAACRSGFCSDGVCCNERCHVAGDTGALCRACSKALGAEEDGRCSPVPDGADPFEDCAQTPQCSPKFAVCDGAGSCKACLCSSALDCAQGYACTAEGSCERPPTEATSPGCAVVARGTDDGFTLAGAALLALVVASGRRCERRLRLAQRPPICHHNPNGFRLLRVTRARSPLHETQWLARERLLAGLGPFGAFLGIRAKESHSRLAHRVQTTSSAPQRHP